MSNKINMGNKIKIKYCSASNCYYKIKNILNELKNEGIEFEEEKCGCLGYCGFAPVAFVNNNKLIPVNKKILKDIYKDPNLINNLNSLKFEKENKILMKNNDEIDPENIESYIKVGGLKGFEKSLNKDPNDLIKEIEISGLRGRGGAAFPTFKKLQAVKNYESDVKYLAANLEEGEVGSFNNHILADSNPFSIVEGILIASYIIKAKKAFIFVNHKGHLAIKRLHYAVNSIRSKGLFSYIDKDFDIEIRRSPSSYVAGEESAMLEVIEGKKAFPRNKPPYPVSVGLFKKPTLINNVETLANLPFIIYYGAKEYASFGINNSKGTKMISLTGFINNPCVNEIPFGIKISEIIDKVGFKVKGEIKGLLIGGPSGGIVSKDYIDTLYDYDEIYKLGAMVGSGALYVIPFNQNIVELVRYLMKFFADESCGQCIPCRVGTVKLTEILDNLLNNSKPLPNNLDEINDFIMKVSLCGLGQAAPIPLITAMKYFPDEFKVEAR
ncbi:MAG: NADH-ubiquinone oxidoreductase-F iron-sulfur binding region domain-containing protein [bacterium]|jgi:NADH:ubiquinone oxidoreductase subunit F (NADH-binding)